MRFDVIICTYNRPQAVLNLVHQLETCSLLPATFIVVDSSDDENVQLSQHSKVKYLRSSHKNQPYQRYIGFTASTAEVLVFLDDDLELINGDVFKVLMDCYAAKDVAGVSGGVDYESVISTAVGNDVDSSTTGFKILNFISGVPLLKPGKIYPMGLAGPLLKKEGRVDYFHGPFMTFKKAALDSIYDPVLFSLYEEKLGKGEDKVISMKVGLKDTLWYFPTIFFRHPPVTSHYFSDVRSFYRRLGFSRFFLTITYSRHTGKNLFFAIIHYYYFMIWRLAIAGFRYIVKMNADRLAVFRGYWDGFLMTFRKRRLSRNKIDWQAEALKDAK